MSALLLEKMTGNEKKSTFLLALVMALRMLGLFMVLPIFSLYADHLTGATPLLIGLAIGIYGLTQGLFQIPFGMLSDHLGRKKIIILGLLIFTLGSIISALTQTINGMILGRALQGMGAVGSTIMALIADLTREEQRTKAMAIVGITIGFSFSLAFILGPLLSPLINVNGLFWLAALFSVLAIFILTVYVPNPKKLIWHADTEPELTQFSILLKNPELLRLNTGIFILHAVLTATFVVVPVSLYHLAGLQGNQQWYLYLPILILAFGLTIPCIMYAEKKRQLKLFFLLAIFALGLAEFFLWIFAQTLLLSALALLLFFIAFSILEAFLPSLVSRTAPPTRKGTALGLYSSSQFLGIFIGGAMGGWLYGKFGLTNVHLFCVILIFLWGKIALKMQPPQSTSVLLKKASEIS